jgi:hypothetical protein
MGLEGTMMPSISTRTDNAGGGVNQYPAARGWHTYTLEYSEMPVLVYFPRKNGPGVTPLFRPT